MGFLVLSRRQLLLGVVCLLILSLTTALCPNACSFRGSCNQYNQCECFDGYYGGDCSLKYCPMGKAWTYQATAVDSIHNEVECSNAGLCNTATGVCTCYNDYVGQACDRLGCGSDCNGNGACVSMERNSDTNYNAVVLSYSNIWDHDMIFGCQCDSGFTGHDCSIRVCPTGDDPLTTGQVDEVQLVRCLTYYLTQEVSLLADAAITEGQFTLRLGSKITTPLNFDATATEVTTALEALSTVADASLTVTRSGDGTTGGTTDDDDDEAIALAAATLYTWTVVFDGDSYGIQLEPAWRMYETQSIVCSADGGAFMLTVDDSNAVSIPFDATATEMEALLESLTVVVDVTVWYVNVYLATAIPDDDVSHTDQACNAVGNTIYVELIEVLSQGPDGDGNLAAMTADLTNADTVYDTQLTLTGGTAVLADSFDEVQRGLDSCRVVEVQTFFCRATSGTLSITFAGTTFTLLATATAAIVKATLEASSMFHQVTVTFTGTTTTPVAVCSTIGTTVTISFDYPAHANIAGQVDGDLPLFTAASTSLAHTILVIVDSSFTESVKGAVCTPLDVVYEEDMDSQMQTSTTTGGGSLQFEFMGHVTADVPAYSRPDDVQAYLEALESIDGVTVSFSQRQLCQYPANVVSITFTENFGDLREIDVDFSELYAGGSVLQTSDGGTLGGILSIKGTKEEEACANRGTCDEVINGDCTCFTYYDTSDGHGAAGTRGDCGTTTSVIDACPGEIECSAHGACAGDPTYRCSCADGWTGGDCSDRTCETGVSWFDYPVDVDEAHTEVVECSNRGICDRSTGECTCQNGFFGGACQYMSCPLDCSGHGRCLSLAEIALLSEDNGDATDYTYGATANDPYTWDAHRIFGCLCDDDYSGAGCELRECPWGDDPMTYDDAVEVQVLLCLADSGTFDLSFRQEVATIAFDATATEVETALETLDTISDVTVEFSSSTDAACSTDSSNTISVTFDADLGTLPDFIVDVTSLVDATNGDGTDGSGSITLGTKGDTVGDYTSVEGTREYAPCSNRGICDYSTGLCTCFSGFTTSDGLGNKGDMGDCGYIARALKFTSGTSAAAGTDDDGGGAAAGDDAAGLAA